MVCYSSILNTVLTPAKTLTPVNSSLCLARQSRAGREHQGPPAVVPNRTGGSAPSLDRQAIQFELHQLLLEFRLLLLSPTEFVLGLQLLLLELCVLQGHLCASCVVVTLLQLPFDVGIAPLTLSHSALALLHGRFSTLHVLLLPQRVRAHVESLLPGRRCLCEGLLRGHSSCLALFRIPATALRGVCSRCRRELRA